MANYVPSAIATAQTLLSAKYQEAELRRKQRPVVAMALQNQDYTIVDHAALKVADARPIDVFYRLKRAAGAGVQKAARHTGTKGDSAKVTLAYVRFTETFKISRKQAQNNVIGWQTMFNHEIEEARNNLMDRMETAGLAYLVANRCQLLAAGLTTSSAGTWSDANKALEIAAGNKPRFAQFAKSFMNGRFYRGEFDVFADLMLARELEYNSQQGGGNTANLSFQFAGLNVASTNEAILGAYTGGSALFMPKGTFAGLNWTDPENRKNSKEDAYVGFLGTMQDPFGSGFMFDVSVYSDRSDESAVGGHIQDIKDEWEITGTIAWALPPLSLASDSPVHLIAQA